VHADLLVPVSLSVDRKREEARSAQVCVFARFRFNDLKEPPAFAADAECPRYGFSMIYKRVTNPRVNESRMWSDHGT